MALALDDRLDALTTALNHMSHQVEKLVKDSLTLVGGVDIDELAKDVIRGDLVIDRQEVEIEEKAIEMLALHQPRAGDLRVIVAVLKINNDLERIGDHAANIARAAGRLGRLETKVPVPPELGEMGRIACGMLGDALDAFVHESTDEAAAVRERDDRVDQLLDSLVRIMLTHMPEHHISGCLEVILIGRNLERIADLATNIAEDVIFMVQGRTVRHGVRLDRAGGGPKANS